MMSQNKARRLVVELLAFQILEQFDGLGFLKTFRGFCLAEFGAVFTRLLFFISFGLLLAKLVEIDRCGHVLARFFTAWDVRDYLLR